VKVPEPQFEGQTKTKLGNSEVSGIVQTTVARALEAYSKKIQKKLKNIISKVVLAGAGACGGKEGREMVQRKTF
jgi:DNA gyrase subunit B